MKLKLNCLVYLACFVMPSLISSFIYAQHNVNGKVSTIDNQPIVSATVAVKGTNIATTSGVGGLFSISVPSGRTILVVSFVEYETVEVAVTADVINITMRPRTSTLNEIVVTGYISQAKKDITGSVSVVNTKDLKSQPSANAETMLQGRASGVTVVTDNRPGVGALVRIRGFGSFGAFGQNTPLFIIDGIPADNLTGLNPNDIETMQVLKDAASASIYGARASAGVIIITTRRGRQGTAKVSYNMYYGTQDPGHGHDLLNSQEMADLFFLSYRNSGETPPSTQYGSGADPVLPDYILPAGTFEGDSAVNPALYKLDLDDIGGSYLIMRANKQGTNWYKEITENAPIMNHNISVSGGAEKSRYLLSFDYFSQDAIFKWTFFKRYTTRVNTEFSVKKNIRLGENIQILYSQDNTAGNNSEGTPLWSSFLAQPIIPVFDIMGNFAGPRAPELGNGPNPYADRYRAKDSRNHNMNLFGNLYAEVDFLKHFTARSSFGGQYNNNNYYYFINKTYENTENYTANRYTEGFSRYRAWTWTNQLTYKNVFARKHDVQVLLGTEAVEDWGRNVDAARFNYFIEDVNFRSLNSGGAAGQVAQGAPYTPSSIWSLFGRVDYVYNDKYLAGFAIRRDGSSRFGPNNPYATFPAASIGWRISRENFMQNISWISDMKIRASYGSLGNQKIDPANAFTQFRGDPGSSNYDINGTSNSIAQGFQVSFVGNPDGKWETNTVKNAGVEATLFNGKTEVIFDVYEKKTKDLLYNVPAIATAGAGAANNPSFVNVASMKNTGVDLLITQRANIGGRNGVSIDASLTFTSYKNVITSLAEGFDFFEARDSRIGFFIRNQIHHPISSYFGYKVIGLFQDDADVNKSPVQDAAAPGRFKYADLNGNDSIDIGDRTFLGSPHPDFTYGLQINSAYKGLDLSFFFYGAQGKETMNYVRWWIDFFPSFQNVKSHDALYNSWTPQKPNAKVPIAESVSNFSNNSVVNSYYLEKSSYLKLKYLTIGYTLPSSLMSRIKVDMLRIYVQATNLFTITKYTGLDPEISGWSDVDSGVDEGVYPAVRQFLVGVNLNF